MTPAPALARRLAALGAAPHLLVCTDYDGTLAPLARRPEEAQLLPGAFDLLNGLADLPNTRVAVISGRSRADLRAHSGLDGPILLVGSHGAELPGQEQEEGNAIRQSRIDGLTSTLSPFVASAPGAWLERKPFGLAVHVREANEKDANRVLAGVRQAAVRWPDIYKTEGKAVIELSLSRTDKGRAIDWLRDAWGTAPRVLFLGDDVTDEAGFAVLGPLDLGIKVGAGASRAHCRVGSEQAALNLLGFVRRQRVVRVADAQT
jgi:trehalose 6-phosphate phosphatase